MFSAKTLQEKLSTPCVTRFAPSPTGFFHVGSARCALQANLAAEASGGKFILRIDDTDTVRNSEEALDLIFASLAKLELYPCEIFKQSENTVLYSLAFEALLAKRYLREDAGAFFLSQKTAELLPDFFWDIAAGKCSISSTTKEQVCRTIVKTSKASFTYQLASVVDDIECSVSFITRGADHLSNTPKQIAIALALREVGWNKADSFCQGVDFAHSGLLCINGKKISKRDAVSDFRSILENYNVLAVKHWLSQLGWSHPDSNFDAKMGMYFLTPGQFSPVFKQGKLKVKNMEASLEKLKYLDKLYKTSARIKTEL